MQHVPETKKYTTGERNFHQQPNSRQQSKDVPAKRDPTENPKENQPEENPSTVSKLNKSGESLTLPLQEVSFRKGNYRIYHSYQETIIFSTY